MVKWFRTLLGRHNDPADDFQFDMFSGVVVGRDVNAERYNVRIKASSPWFLVNVLTQ